MVDFYKNCCLSRFGKDAGNQSMAEFRRNIINNYDRCLSQIIGEKEKPIASRDRNFELYL